jgi:hypothetical protein
MATKEELAELAKLQAEYAVSLKKTAEQKQKELAIDRELLKSMKQRIQEDFSGRKSLNDRIEKNLRLLDIRREETKLLDEAITLQEDLVSEQDKAILSLEQELERVQSLSEEDRKRLDLAGEGDKALTEKINKLRDEQAATEELIQAALKQLKIQKESVEAVESLEGTTKNIIGATLGISNAWEKTTLVGQLAVASRDAGGLSKGLSMIADTAKETFSPMNILGSTLMKIQESTFKYAIEQDKALAGFNKASGAAGKYDEVITKVNVENRNLGISIGDSVNAVASLRSEMAGFRGATDDAVGALTEHVAIMEKMGVATGDSAKMLNMLTKGLQMSDNAAMDMQTQLVGLADSLGKDVNVVMTEFNSAAQELMKYGDGMMEVFKGLQAASNATGVAMNDLLGIAKQFDTFEGAATSAARLNAVLGANLDAYSLLEASEENRIRMLIESIEMGGKSWQSMSRFEQQAVANAAGIRDMAQANAIFGQSLAEYDAAQAQAEATGLSQEEQAERAKIAMDVQQSMAMAMESLAISMRPVVEMFKSFTQFLAEHGQIVSYITLVIGALSAAYALGNIYLKIRMGLQQYKMMNDLKELGGISGVVGALGAETAAKGTNTGVTEVNNGVKQQASMVNQNLARSTWAAVAPTLAFGAAILMIGGAIAIAALGMAQLVKSFAGLTGEQITGAITTITILTLGMVALGAVLGVLVYTGVLPGAAASMLAFGVALLLAGAGIYIVAQGMADMAPHIMMLGLYAPQAALGIGSLAVGMFGLGVSLLLVSGSKLKSIAETMTAMSNISADFETFSRIAGAIKEISAALDELDEEKTIAFGTSMESLAELSKTFTAKATVTAVGAANVVAAAGGRTAAAATETRFEQMAVAAGAPRGGGSVGPIEVVLKMNDREFARAVTKVIDDEL